MAWEVRRGLEGMRRVVKQNRIQGVHGVLIDLLDVIQGLQVAVEVRSFHSPGPNIAKALTASTMQGTEHERIQGVHGVLIDLLDVIQGLQVAVEVRPCMVKPPRARMDEAEALTS